MGGLPGHLSLNLYENYCTTKANSQNQLGFKKVFLKNIFSQLLWLTSMYAVEDTGRAHNRI